MPLFKTDFSSAYLRRNVSVEIVVPGLTPGDIDRGGRWSDRLKAKYPVIYLLHGYWGNERSWSGFSSMERYAEEHQIAIVTMSGENNFYVNLQEFSNTVSDRIFPPDYYSFLEKELPDFVKTYFPVSSRREDTYIAGLSMGGYGALIHGLAHANRYRAVGAFSPVTTIENFDIFRLGQGLTSAQLAKYEPVRIIRRAKALPDLYYAYGDKDHLLPCQDWFEEQLVNLGVKHTLSRREGLAHEWRLWDEELEKFIAWLPRTDAYAESGKRSV